MRAAPKRFVREAAAAGVDGLIIVDLPPEEDAVLLKPAHAAGIDIIRLVTPTTHDARLAKVLNGASGYLYYVSITGVTGTKSFAEDDVKAALTRIRKASNLPGRRGFRHPHAGAGGADRPHRRRRRGGFRHRQRRSPTIRARARTGSWRR